MCPTLTCPLGTRTRLSLRSVFLFYMYSNWKKSWLWYVSCIFSLSVEHLVFLLLLSISWRIITKKSYVILPVLIAAKQQLTVKLYGKVIQNKGTWLCRNVNLSIMYICNTTSTCIHVLWQVDDANDESIVSLLRDSQLPEGFMMLNTHKIPGSTTLASNLQVFI